MTQFTRRTFLKTGSLAVAAAALPRSATAAEIVAEVAAAQDMRALTAAALEAAKAAGAKYADAHFHLIRSEGLYLDTSSFYTDSGFSVRALVNGYWGFAAQDGVASLEDAARMGRDAAGQARIAAAKGKPRTVDLAAIPAPANGSWSTPVEIDPFTVSIEEKGEFFAGMRHSIMRLAYGIGTGGSLSFRKHDNVFASTEGAYSTQTIYTSQGDLTVSAPNGGNIQSDFMLPAGAGWEYILNAPFQDKALEMIEESKRSGRKKPVDVGRYDLVLDARAMGNMLSTTIGAATQLHRALGFEANGIGTSYIDEPLEMLGTYQVGSPLLNVTINRSAKGRPGTVKWDDEGVEPSEATLVKNGVLTDMQTTREFASWLSEYYQKNNMPVRSNGCAGQPQPTSPVSFVGPNMVMAPGATEASFEDMIKDTKKGYAILGGYSSPDFQALNGAGYGNIIYEISEGKIGSAISGAQYMFRSPEFWKGLVAVGGKSSVRNVGWVTAVPGKVTKIRVTDVMRKA